MLPCEIVCLAKFQTFPRQKDYGIGICEKHNIYTYMIYISLSPQES